MERTARKNEILTVAAKLFRERGYSAVSMRDIAQELDIKAASLYNHITSKQEMLVLIVIEIAEEFTLGMRQIAASDAPAKSKIQELIGLHIDLTLRNPDEMACLNSDWMHLEAENRAYFIRMRDEYEDQFKSIVQLGMSRQEFQALDLDVVVYSMLSSLRTLYHWYGRKKNISANALKNTMIRTLLEGILI